MAPKTAFCHCEGGLLADRGNPDIFRLLSLASIMQGLTMTFKLR